MWDENPEYHRTWGKFFLGFIVFLTILILIASVFTSDYIFIIGWLGALLIFAIICMIYGIIAVGFAKTIFAILNFFERKQKHK
ncbi:MAG: hypothetical protein WAX69_14495, partial [Victivallales bacterium]